MIASTRIVIAATHPIQYQTPWFQQLASVESIHLTVLFMQMPDAGQQGTGFAMPFKWDVPLLEGYHWQLAQGLRGHGGLEGFFATRLDRPLRLLRELKPDVLLVTGWHAWPLLQLLLAARRLAVPTIMRGESNALRQRAWPVRPLHRALLAQCAAFLTIGKANRDFYRGYGVPDARLFSAPYCVDNARFAAAQAGFAARRGALRTAWNIPPGATCFCFAGKLQPKKRIVDLLEALRLATGRAGQPLHLLVVGTGEQLAQAQAFATRHRLPATFAGFLNQTEIASAYTASDCLVLPSDHGETWGLVVNEAMACGLPAIVSDRAGCGPDLITGGVTGATFPCGDVRALAETMLQMAADPAGLRAMGTRARQRVLNEYSVERAVAGTLDAISYVRSLR